MDSDINTIYNSKQIYKVYKKIISEMIAYIEVYEHDLPGEVMEEMADLFQVLAIYETCEESSYKMDNMLYREQHKITQTLYKDAIYVLIKRIDKYKKMFKKYKKGVMKGEIRFDKWAGKEETDIVKSFSEKMTLFYKNGVNCPSYSEYCKLSPLQKMIIKSGLFKSKMLCKFSSMKRKLDIPIEFLIPPDLALVNEENEGEFELYDLQEVFDKTKKLLEEYEQVAPKVISNGTKQSVSAMIFVAVTGWIIPIVLAIPVVGKILSYFR